MKLAMYLSGSMLALVGVAQAQQPPAAAQVPAQPTRPAPAAGEEGGDDEAEVVVTGQRPFGSVVGDVRPEQTLNAADVRGYGVSSIAELLTELGPQTNAAAGPPVVLLNGKRISGFSEIRDLPPEAIQRVEILPEDVSLSYGYAANQKVVNIVLRRRFRAITGEVAGGTTTDPGRANGRVEANVLTIASGTRYSLDGTYTAAGRLLESERDIVAVGPASPFSLDGNVTAVPGALSAEIDPALSALAGQVVSVAAVPPGTTGRPTLNGFAAGANVAGVSDLGQFRSLAAATSNLTLNGVIAKSLSDKVQGSFNGRFERTTSDGLQGLPALSLNVPAGGAFSPFARPVQLYRYSATGGALEQRTRGDALHAGLTLNGELAKWQWSLTGNYDRSVTRTETERGVDAAALQAAVNAGDPAVNPFGVLPGALLGTRLTDTARSRSSGAAADLLITGPLFDLPAGRATTSVTVSGATNDFASRSMRSGVVRDTGFSRDIAGVRGNIDLPITSRRRNFGSAIGDLALNANAAIQRLSDAGSLTTLGYGLRWTPIPALRFIASQTFDRDAPSGQQINDPTIVTPNVPVFDYRTGDTVFVSRLSGGNPALLETERNRIRLQMTAKPFTARDLTLTATFTDNRTDNAIGSFPVPTPQIEAAFPGRFVRDASGQLTQIDARAINFAERRSTQLRYGFNFSKPLKSILQKRIEAWRAAGAKPADRPKELTALMEARDAFIAQRQRQRGARGGASGENTPAEGENAPRTERPRGDGEGGGRGPGGFGGGGGGFGGGGFGGGGRGGGGGGGRLQFALFDTWHINESITIAPGVPRLDLLDGAAIGSNGGESRHEFEGQAGYTNDGLGARLSVNYRTPTRVDGALGGALGTASSTLRFGGLATADLRLFANLGQMVPLVTKHPFLRGSRVSLAVLNVFDAQQDVRDATGAVPLSYQPDRIDPLGRRIALSFRKLFF
ncbi:MAG: TonB-dependent receptor [Pseudomonadota bacterium]